MRLKRSIRSAAILLCLMAWLFCLTYPALAGQGCGTNWLGSDANDKDFWVSKNQNKGISSPGASVSTATVGSANTGSANTNSDNTNSDNTSSDNTSSANANSANNNSANIGSDNASSTNISSGNAGQSSITQGLNPDKPSPQMAGSVVIWIAGATSSQKGVLYKFLLKGPSTEGMLVDKTSWIPENTWIWNTTAADVGENQIEVRMRSGRYLGSDANGYDESRTAKYIITTETAEEDVETPAPIDPNPHPKSRTADVAIEKTKTTIEKTKPRVAPDERPKQPAGNPNGPNMSMPDPNPKPLVSAEDTNVEANVEEEVADFPEVEAPVVQSKPRVLDMGGKWTVKFEDLGSTLELILIQTGERLMGSGTLSEGKTKIPVTASGSVSRGKLQLEAKTVVGDYVNQIDKSFEMELAESGSAFSGSYEAYEGEKLLSEGNATALKPGL